MKKAKEEIDDTSIVRVIGGLLVIFAITDLVLSWAGLNLTSFLGPVSRFSPIIFGLIGSTLMSVGSKEGD